MMKEFFTFVQKNTGDKTLTSDQLNTLFCQEYIENTTPLELTAINFEKVSSGGVLVSTPIAHYLPSVPY